MNYTKNRNITDHFGVPQQVLLGEWSSVTMDGNQCLHQVHSDHHVWEHQLQRGAGNQSMRSSTSDEIA